jgi:hypothetical protein
MTSKIGEDITEAEIMQLAHNMVAAGNLNLLYGIDPFIQAKARFADSLARFSAQIHKARPLEIDSTLHIDTGIREIPEILSRNRY